MKKTLIISFLTIIVAIGFSTNSLARVNTNTKIDSENNSIFFQSGYSLVNGIKMYYEIYGEGKPLVLIHGGGSTIQTNFGKLIPLLAKDRKIIAVELQAHGRTSDRKADLTFEQDADDVVELLKNLNIKKADFLGFSNGGTTTMQIAIRHPELVNKMILGSVLAKRNGVPDWFWGFMAQAKLENMPSELKEGYKKVAADTNGLRVMHDKDAKRVINFKDIPNEQIIAITAPTLIVIADKDVITIDHAVELHKLIKNSDLAIIPGVHGEYLGEITTIKSDYKDSDLITPIINKFLDKAEK